MSKATIFDVAKMAGVSIKTVSRVVNGEPNVRESTKERVQVAVANLNYRPDQSARNLASQRSHLIVLVYDDPTLYEIPSAGYIMRLQSGVLKACQSAHSELLIHPCNYRDREIGSQLRSLIEQTRPEGIILAAPLSNMTPIIDAIAATRTPYVRLSPGNGGIEEYCVGTSDRESSAEMTRYLASLGHKKIAFVAGNSSHKAVGNRLLGYKDGLKNTGLPYNKELVAQGDNSFGSGVECAERLLKLPTPPTAIFAANDDMAIGVIRVAGQFGISVPGELSVAGCDDIALARQSFPTLTTIRQPLESMAERAALALIKGKNGGTPKPEKEIIPATLQLRESTGPAPAGS